MESRKILGSCNFLNDSIYGNIAGGTKYRKGNYSSTVFDRIFKIIKMIKIRNLTFSNLLRIQIIEKEFTPQLALTRSLR